MYGGGKKPKGKCQVNADVTGSLSYGGDIYCLRHN